MRQNTEQFIQLSQDGSHTVYSNKYQAHYHSIYGAIEESVHVFISAGLYYLFRKGYKHISIFEMGFGTGLNTFLSLLEADHLDICINYTSIESDPVSPIVYESLNYPEILGVKEDYHKKFHLLHTCTWNQEINISDRFSFRKINDRIENIKEYDRYDLIFYDAFAPSCQAELWKEDIHGKLIKFLKTPGVLTTYCTQGAFKRTLLKLGYHLDILDGPGKKREMLRALKA